MKRAPGEILRVNEILCRERVLRLRDQMSAAVKRRMHRDSGMCRICSRGAKSVRLPRRKASTYVFALERRRDLNRLKFPRRGRIAPGRNTACTHHEGVEMLSRYRVQKFCPARRALDSSRRFASVRQNPPCGVGENASAALEDLEPDLLLNEQTDLMRKRRLADGRFSAARPNSATCASSIAVIDLAFDVMADSMLCPKFFQSVIRLTIGLCNDSVP